VGLPRRQGCEARADGAARELERAALAANPLHEHTFFEDVPPPLLACACGQAARSLVVVAGDGEPVDGVELLTAGQVEDVQFATPY
jgi:hypothetical protein